MILGLGVDLCRIERIRRSIVRFGKAWLDEVFTEEEQELLVANDQQAHYAAVGFALKEACSKAIGAGFAEGIQRRDFIVTIAGSHCSVTLTAAARHRATQLCPSATSYSIHTHFLPNDEWANAIAILATKDDHLSHIFDHLAFHKQQDCVASLRQTRKRMHSSSTAYPN